MCPSAPLPGADRAWPHAVLHLDMDAFYVNVHLLDHPEDAGQPLAVGGRPDQRGVLASASYEARRLGIHSAMPSSRALRLCPQLRIVPADWDRIRACSRQVMELLATFGPLEQMSVDEAYLDLTAVPAPVAVAAEIKRAVVTGTRLPCSIGLASSKLVAKVASDHDKPDGFTAVEPGAEAAFLAPKAVRAIWGIGPRTAAALAELHIHTCGDLAKADPRLLTSRLGRQAADLIQRAQGLDPRPVQADRGPAKSISQEWTFATDVNDEQTLLAHLREMCQDVTESLRKKDMVAQTIVVKFRWADFTTFTRQKSLSVATDQPDEICSVAQAIFQENWPVGRHMRLLGVGVSNLGAREVRQLRLNFPETGER